MSTVSNTRPGRNQLNALGDASETGFGVLLGLGYDFRISENVSITPFWDGYAVSSDVLDVNVGQIGVGVTVH